MALIWSALTNSNGAGMPSNSTRIPANSVSTAPEANTEGPTPTVGPRPRPVMLMISPGAMGPGKKLAAFRMERTKVSPPEEPPLTVSVTGRFCTGMDVSVGVTVMMPEYLPVDNPVGVTETMRVAGVIGVVLVVGGDTETLSQLPPIPAVAVAVNAKSDAGLVTLTVCGVGIWPAAV